MPTSAPHDPSAWPSGPWTTGTWVTHGGPRGSRWFPVVFAQLVQLPVLLWLIVAGPHVPQLIAAIVSFLSSYLLLLLPERPGPTVVALAVTAAPALLLVTAGPPLAAVPLAFGVVGATARGARAWVWGTIGTAAVAAVGYGTMVSAWPALVRSLVVLLVLSLLIGIGEAIRGRRDRYAELRSRQAEQRRTEAERERLRIARELHDVLAHSLSSITVQAGVGLHLIEEHPDKAAEALANIKETSRTALSEVRGVLGFLRSGEDGAPLVPEPDIDRLPALVDSMSRLGVSVALRGELAPGVPASNGRALYRIVQEALTNITRHSDATTATVSLATVESVDTVVVQDDGHPSGTPLDEGRGLTGMRERAALLGGSLSAGVADGGFRVEARLPRKEAT